MKQNFVNLFRLIVYYDHFISLIFFYFSFNNTLLFTTNNTTISIPFSFKITSVITKTMYMSVRNKNNYLHNLTPII
jgi:hypothetical protein